MPARPKKSVKNKMPGILAHSVSPGMIQCGRRLQAGADLEAAATPAAGACVTGRGPRRV
jgi:hypothetical protein